MRFKLFVASVLLLGLALLGWLPDETLTTTPATPQQEAFAPLPVQKILQNRDDFLWERYLLSKKSDKTGDFSWKDAFAARSVGMNVRPYVIEGLDETFRDQVVALLHGLDNAGLTACITSAYRGPERQALITAGFRAKKNSSYHGSNGIARGHGLGSAVDIAACGSAAEREILNDQVWSWIDHYGSRFGFVRPYGDKDPPHVSPIDGLEYRNILARRAAKEKTKQQMAQRH